MQFQGGFVGQECVVELLIEGLGIMSEPFYPEDNNLLQNFTLSQPQEVKYVRFVFGKSTDFYGRLIIYELLIR